MLEMLDPRWKEKLGPEAAALDPIEKFLTGECAADITVYPPAPDIFTALNLTPPENVSVVILGQDPYHGEGQAHGLAFSVPQGIKPPPSLVNIYKEIESEFGVSMPRDQGTLTKWARQGVLLLNATLTVRAGAAGSHHGRGWEKFTDAIVRSVNDLPHPVAFLLWGAPAQKKGAIIDRQRHLVLEAPHPSPLSAYRGFFGCGHFKKANDFLAAHGRAPVDWTQTG